MRRDDIEDDGRTIADMSELPDQSLTGLLIGRRLAENLKSRERKSLRRKTPDLTREERRSYLAGAMKASLLIGLVYLAAFALFIVLLLWIFGVL